MLRAAGTTIGRVGARGFRTTVDTLNSNVLAAQYAVRGAILQRAEEIEADLNSNRSGRHKFSHISYANIGNPHQVGVQPLTFPRQVLSCVEYPALLTANIFPTDVVQRAFRIISDIGGQVGAYSHSQGFPTIRDDVASFIGERDGHPTTPESLFLGNGASSGISTVLQMYLRPNTNDSILIPMPQYPLYSATISLLGGIGSPYYLDEEAAWALTVPMLEKALEKAKRKGENPRALAVINPGNPTGTAMTEKQIADVVKWCDMNEITIFADEVYQENIYEGSAPFNSFRKVVKDQGSNAELFSFHSLSKGFVGECGHRGGYMHLTNIHKDVHQQIYKLASVSLCPNTAGQVLLGVMANPPKPGDDSHEQYAGERDTILSSYQRKSKELAAAFDALPGIECQPVTASMYAFPKVSIPAKAVAEAESKGVEPDFMYCMELLEETGLCVVPGSGFGQAPGTYHFRTTFLPPQEEITASLKLFAEFHTDFMKRYA